MISDRRLCLDSTKTIVVEADDPRAAYLLVGAGCSLDDADARHFGLEVEADKVKLAPEPEPGPEPAPPKAFMASMDQPPKGSNVLVASKEPKGPNKALSIG